MKIAPLLASLAGPLALASALVVFVASALDVQDAVASHSAVPVRTATVGL
ncbi:MAG: hypothetical protein M3Z29_15035 [Pseudomonadota bacterium]|nr:hypothetical protein [Pseudomonadota bacterium]